MRFSDVYGHQWAKDHLLSLAAENRLPHALLIAGPPGIGKLMLARALAQYLHCQHPMDGDSCGQCPSCRQHEALSCADLHFTYPTVAKVSKVCAESLDRWKEFLATSPLAEPVEWNKLLDTENSQPIIYKDEAEEIVRRSYLSAYSQDRKIHIVWCPEKMNAEAANRLLKVIEEPADDTNFIFVSDRPNDILPTIFSRLQVVNLQRFTEEEMVLWLHEGKGLGEEEARQLAPLCEGSLLKAEALADSQGERREFASLFATMMRAAYGRQGEQLKKLSLEMADMKREKSRRFFAYCAQMLRENYMFNLHIPGFTLQLPEEQQFSQRFAPFINERNVEEILAHVTQASSDIEHNSNAKLVCLDFLFQLMFLIRK